MHVLASKFFKIGNQPFGVDKIKQLKEVIDGLNYLSQLSLIIKSGIASPPGGLLVKDKANDKVLKIKSSHY